MNKHTDFGLKNNATKPMSKYESLNMAGSRLITEPVKALYGGTLMDMNGRKIMCEIYMTSY